MKILHITETAKGGVGTYIDMLTRLERDQFESHVVLPDAHQDMLSRETIRRTFRYPKRSVASLVRLVLAALRERIVFKPNIIFCHSTFSLLALLVLRPVSPGTKFIYCAHGWAGAREIPNSRKVALVRRIEGVLCGLAHRVVNISERDLNYVQNAGYSGRHIMIENAAFEASPDVVPAVFTGPEEAIHLLFVGRLDQQKGLDILLAAYDLARQKNPFLRLHVIGEEVITQAQETGISVENVDFLGWIGSDEIDSYYRAANLLVVPSRWEGFGLVVIEAYRNGTPVLSSDRGALPDIVLQGVTGKSIKLSIETFSNELVGLSKENLELMRPACLSQFERRYHVRRFKQEIFQLYGELTLI